MEGIIGVLLAGGQSSRMGGGDKCLTVLAGQTLLARTIARAGPQVDRLILNANGDSARFADTALPVIQDTIAGFAGPLAGILAASEWVAANYPQCRHIASFATDTPFFPQDLVARLSAARDASHTPLACAASGGRTHPVFGLWPVSLAADLRHAIENENIRKVDLWTARHGVAVANYPLHPLDRFFNINSPDDLAQAEILARTAN